MRAKSLSLSRRSVYALGALLAVAAAIVWRGHVLAWWFDDLGNLALAKGETAQALAFFQTGLRYVPYSPILLEDHGRAISAHDPLAAVSDFTLSNCGAPCFAERGDAEIRLGRFDAAVKDYLAAKAAYRLVAAAAAVGDQNRYDEAISLVQTLIARLRDDPLAAAQLAQSYLTLGRLDEAAQYHGAGDVGMLRRNAIKAFGRATELAPFNEEYLLSYSFAQARWGDPKAARGGFNRLLQLHPQQPDALRGLMMLRRGVFPERRRR